MTHPLTGKRQAPMTGELYDFAGSFDALLRDILQPWTDGQPVILGAPNSEKLFTLLLS